MPLVMASQLLVSRVRQGGIEPPMPAGQPHLGSPFLAEEQRHRGAIVLPDWMPADSPARPASSFLCFSKNNPSCGLDQPQFSLVVDSILRSAAKKLTALVESQLFAVCR